MTIRSSIKRAVSNYPMAPWLLCCMLFYPLVMLFDTNDPMMLAYTIVLFIYTSLTFLIRVDDKSKINYRVYGICYQLLSFPDSKGEAYVPSIFQRYIRIAHYISRLLFISISIGMVIIGLGSLVMPYDGSVIVKYLAQFCLILFACLYIENTDNVFGYREINI